VDYQSDYTAQLKSVLEKVTTPAQLNNHVWAQSLTVVQHVNENPELENQGAGYQLFATLSALFRQMMPSIPPRRGKRLDTAWGQFGILGALYFAPFDFNTTRPISLLDGWGRIDDVILRYVFGSKVADLSLAEIERYRLVGDELETAPKSTVSGWHTKGLERLAAAFLQNEQNLSIAAGEPAKLLDSNLINEPTPEVQKPSFLAQIFEYYHQYQREFWFGIASLIIILIGWKSWRVLSLYRVFKHDVVELQTLATGDEISLELLVDVGPVLTQTRQDVVALRTHVAPFGWAGRMLGWLPIYGGDLANAEYLLDMAAGLVIAGDEGYRAAEPLLLSIVATGDRPDIPVMLATLEAAQPTFAIAQENVSQALTAYEQIDVASLSPKTKPLLEKIEPYLPFLSDGISALPAIPKIAGAEPYGPQTYLIMLQNEDEIRATGGFITAVATVTIDNGEIIAFKVEDSYSVDKRGQIYPPPPWQIEAYMGAPIWVLRDANWSPDFPTTATWIEHLYAYHSAHSVDGVIAIDQEVLRLLLKAVGPLQLETSSEPITAENIVDFMRASRGEGVTAAEWQEVWDERKNFMAPLAGALLNKLQDSSDVSWAAVAQAGLQALDERHLLIQLDDPVAAALLAARGWDGALRPSVGDYLMVVDSNIGFNKANVVLQSAITYQVDLQDLTNPTATLTVSQQNNANTGEPCQPGSYHTHDYQHLIHRCYWNYLRVYTLDETEVISAVPIEIPGEWLLSGNLVPAGFDVLDNQGIVSENPDGLQAYGSLLVVPTQEKKQIEFGLSLPPAVIQLEEQAEYVYNLHVQKQPGTQAHPITIQISFPPGSQVITTVPQGSLENNIWQVSIPLNTDIDISIRFSQ
jgi:hypothetical protein